MSGKYLKLVALSAVLLHLADGLLASWGHSHGPGDAHHACQPVEEHGGHHGECAGHSHHASDEPQEHEHSLPGHDDSDHCAACRHLAQAAVHQFVLTELPTSEQIEPLCCHFVLTDFSQPSTAYQPRGPPAIAL